MAVWMHINRIKLKPARQSLLRTPVTNFMTVRQKVSRSYYVTYRHTDGRGFDAKRSFLLGKKLTIVIVI